MEEIVAKIKKLAAQHQAIDEVGLDDLKEAEHIEYEAGVRF